ncbi:helix-turn-helix domain-containing protein [Amorphus coralli]|uniref:helix-turn-helix domain-containing protein n=1 Tax=Amorphus coralli TaxID=340680 RepID=UPI000367D3F6|nr:helix-turn-helix domain-containing protein [Amorphus coralli]
MTDYPTIITPGGEELVLVPRADFDALIARRDEDAGDIGLADAIVAGVRNGDIATLSDAEADLLLEAPTALSGWRKIRGLTQVSLSSEAGISQNYLSELERGKRGGTTDVLARLARVLRVRIDDLIDE